MTAQDREALDALNHRLGHTAAIARLLREHVNGDVPADVVDAIGGIAFTLDEVATSADAIIHRGDEARTVATPDRLRVLGYDAGHIAAFAEMIATTLADHPDTSQIGQAAEGLTTLARRLENHLLDLADPEA